MQRDLHRLDDADEGDGRATLHVVEHDVRCVGADDGDLGFSSRQTLKRGNQIVGDGQEARCASSSR